VEEAYASARPARPSFRTETALLAEERNVSRAVSRLFLSQPALSRALQRLRAMFHDDLLIRTPTGYEPTARGERLMQELAVMLPRLDRLLSGATFDPAAENATFRIAVSDNASQVVCPLFCRMVLPYAEWPALPVSHCSSGGAPHAGLEPPPCG
jgi:Bacterial regulatory helix-turn-helix protein, lysR family